ncbi:MAG: ATP-binding cassette domain-containing protein [Phycisphaerae bacterium]|nr:ATP-binding cassette domain-containing protein [Phycisphaerae bacterium]
MTKPVIELNSVSFLRKERRILGDICWHIESGEHWALLGANGSGKTSLLRIITGYEWPSRGTVNVLGNEFGKCAISGLRKHIGYVSSAINITLPENDSATDIVLSGIDATIGLHRHYCDDEHKQAYAAMEKMSVQQCKDQSYSILSQGERQRILIARAIINHPDILILDESCAGLDPAAKEHFLADLEILTSHKNAPTIIFVTHHIEEISPWITNVFILKDGICRACGKTEDLLNSETLSDAFDCKCTVKKESRRYYLQVQGQARS